MKPQKKRRFFGSRKSKDFLGKVKKSSEMKEAIEKISKLYKLATRDPKTKLYNAGFFYNQLNHELSVALRYNHQLSLILIDIDDFKKINTKYGYQKADKILIRVAEIIKEDLRTADIAARFGGEEFVLLLPETSQEKAFAISERIRKKIMKDIFLKKFKITISAGISCFKPTGKIKEKELNDDYERLRKIELKIEREDVFAYLKAIKMPTHDTENKLGEILFDQANISVKHAKNSGKNQTVVYTEKLLKSFNKF